MLDAKLTISTVRMITVFPKSTSPIDFRRGVVGVQNNRYVRQQYL